MARSSFSVAVQPVGLDGELMKIARVAGPAADFSLSRSSCQLAPSKPSSTNTGRAPAIPAAAAKFGHAGVGTITSSSLPATAAMAIWMACMPPIVTKNRSGEKARSKWRAW